MPKREPFSIDELEDRDSGPAWVVVLLGFALILITIVVAVVVAGLGILDVLSDFD